MGLIEALGCNFGGTRGGFAMAGNNNLEIGGSPSNVGQQQKRVCQVWRGGIVGLYLKFCFELVLMSHNWILIMNDLCLVTIQSLFELLNLSAHASIMFCFFFNE